MAERHEPQFGGSAGAGRARETERPASERSAVEIVKDIVGNVQEIVRSEIRLATVEMKEKAVQAGRAGGMLAAGAVIALYALAFFLATVYHALSNATAPWLAALLVGLVLAIAAGVLVTIGRKRLKEINPTPERTVDSVREDIEWIRNRKQ